MKRLRIATRGSDLARAQASWVAEQLRSRLAIESDTVVIKTTGDTIQDKSLAKVGGKGLFVKELEEALLEERADIAVHSAKDLPSRIPPGLDLVAFPERADCRDALVARDASMRLETLPRGARVGTGSVRRTALLLAKRPDLEIVPLRGNVPTRLQKLDTGGLDAVILASAGLDRLGLGDRICERLDPDVVLPAVAQGTLAIEMREGPSAWAEAVRGLDDADSGLAARGERSFLHCLEGDCSVPLAALCEVLPGSRARLRGLVCSLDGARIIRSEREVEASPAAVCEAGEAVARDVLDKGGAEILDALHAEGPA
ncbi:MAG: hydroxymethylbilane synthase [Myxococcota bacterium]